MAISLNYLYFDHSLEFVIRAVAVCLLVSWLVATLLRKIRAAPPEQLPKWFIGTMLAAGFGVWTTHFIAIRGYRPDMFLSYELDRTAASAGAAILAVGLPLAASAAVSSAPWRMLLGGVAGCGIAAMHYVGMAAVIGCVQGYSVETVLLAIGIGVSCLALAQGLQEQRRSTALTCGLFTLAVCGAHFVAASGTTLTKVTEAGKPLMNSEVVSISTTLGTTVLFGAALLMMFTARRFETQERVHSAVLSSALDNMSNGLVFLDTERRLGLFNRRFLELCGLSAADLRAGMNFRDVLDAIDYEKTWGSDYRATIEDCLSSCIRNGMTETSELVTGTGRVLEVNGRLSENGGVVLTFDDVTRDREAQRHISDLALLDPLTRLANRRSLQQRMEQDFHPKRSLTLLLVDLDRFKLVNDAYGHGIGDKLLIAVAGRISAVVGSDGFAARLGGDEIAVLVAGGVKEARPVAEQIIDVIGRPFVVDSIPVVIGCSIGICCADSARDPVVLMQQSDVALYEAKRLGRGRACAYRPGMLEAVAERQMLETDMRLAMERGEFYLVYQPVLALVSDSIIGYEALIRWRHPTLGHISPEAFIPLAEETGQIIAIGRWALEEACREASSWANNDYVAVNISPVQFRSPLLLSHLSLALSNSGFPANRLEIELTETALVEDGAQIAITLDAMRTLGVRVAMDDFGTGYSSLAHLRDFPIDRIKIDRTFVATATTDRQSMAVLRGITHIAQELEIDVLAEGVETQEQLELLRSIGCDAIQGYLIGRPQRMRPNSNDGRCHSD